MSYKPSEISNNFLINFYLNGRKEHIINNTTLNKYEACISDILKRNSTYIIETEINHWITVTITENSLFYIEKKECEICLSNKVLAQFATKNNLDIIRQQWNEGNCDCLIYPLFFTMQMIGNNSETDPTKLLIDIYSLNKFQKEFDACKSQFEKIKDKIKVCSNLFLEIKDEMPVITDYKHVLYFIYFVESVALQDCALSNEELKRFIIETAISEKNSEIIKKIRFWILHREESYFIFPQQLHKFTFQEIDSRKIFGYLQKYLDYVYHKLCGEEKNEPENQPFSILCHSENFGNKLGEKNVTRSLEDLSYQFIREGFSLKKSENPEKTLFNFIANFIPLLGLVYRKEKNTFKSLINFRNQLIHNMYVLYQNGKEVPYIAFQNLLYDVKEFLLKFNFCCKVIRELETISITNGIWKSKHNIKKCLQRFKNLFSEELKSPTERDSLEDGEQAVNYLIGKIEQYFRSLFIVDTFNSITISEIKIEKFDLPLVYYKFSEESKNSMFKKFNTIKVINESSGLSENVCKDIEEVIKHELKSYGLSDFEYKRIRNSVLNPQYFDNEKLIKAISKHILSIKELKRRSKFKMTALISDYYMYLENNPKFNFEKYKKIIDFEQFTDKTFEVNIIGSSFNMLLSTILKNFIPLYFNMSPNYASFKTVERIFKDQVILQIIFYSDLDLKKIMKWIDRLSFLAPLGVEILYTQKLKLESDEERNFVFKLMKNLLRFGNNDDFLRKLLLFKIKDKNLIENCFDQILKIDLIQRKPQKLCVFFSFPIIQDRLLSILKSDYEYEYIPNMVISCLNYQYNSAYEVYKKQNYKDALDLVDRRPAGLSLFLRDAVDKNIMQDEIRILEIKFLISKIKFQNGFEEHCKQSENAIKHFSKSLYILDALLTKILNSNIEKEIRFMWEQRIKVLKARILHFMGDCKESSDQYKNIFLELCNIYNNLDKDKESLSNLYLDNFGFINPKNKNKNFGKIIKELLHTEKYKFAIQLNRRDLQIPKILMYYSEELHCQMWTLSKTEDIFDQCVAAISSCKFAIDIQRKIFRRKHFMVKQTSSTLLKLFELLREICHNES